ncbi:MAG: hypothetical protein NWE98_10220 [Candidatus Bathyarchaeota archaeon]|nr:hypothetical protein [Candidatus Bathyarchaeota archaeon]
MTRRLMLTSITKRFILPFSNPANKAFLSSEAEAAAVFTIIELSRSKGGGIINRQPEEQIAFIANLAYPIWAFPKNDFAYFFDAIDDSPYSILYNEEPSVKTFLERLEQNSRPRENYMAFLSEHKNYFQNPLGEKQFQIAGLIADPEFKEEFMLYRKEAKDASGQTNLAVLLPILEESTVSSTLLELERLQSTQKEDAQRLAECQRLVNKTTSQYITEIDYEVTAVKEETDAKIKAQEELINPQIAKLNMQYRHKIKELTISFDQEIENTKKAMAKTEKSIESNELKIKQYQREAKAQAERNHKLYEKRWKEKIKQTQREINTLKKALKNSENNLKKISKQKAQSIARLNFELDAEVKLARQPIFDLEAARDAKIQFFKQETERLVRQEKPVLEGLTVSIRQREAINAKFEALGIKDPQLKNPALFYIPFYVCCYRAGLARRYLVLPPSTVGTMDFSAKLKSTLGLSITKDLFVPRFNAVAKLLAKMQSYARQNSAFESQLWTLGEKNNLLRNTSFREGCLKGLVYLEHAGWFSDKEQQKLSSRLSS